MTALPVLITGASSGIGADFARIFARKGHPLALVARSGSALEVLALELVTPGVRAPVTLALDLSTHDAAERLAAALAEQNFCTEILVNNAGYGLNGPVGALDAAGQLGIVDLNIRALTDITLKLLPEITAAKGRILNVASTAAFLPGPGMAVYYASKAYVLSFSEALSHELAASGVSVTALCPGPTETDFFRRAGGKAGKLKSLGMMKSMDVAEAGYRGLMAGKRVVVPGFMNKLVAVFGPLAPRALLLPAVARVQLGK